MQFFYIILAVLIKYILPTFHSGCQPSSKISSKYLNPRLNYNNFFEIQDGGRLLSWIFDNLILSNRSPWVVLFPHCTTFGAKMLLDAELWAKIEIQDGGRLPSWIFENQISEHWDPLGSRFSISVPNLTQKC